MRLRLQGTWIIYGLLYFLLVGSQANNLNYKLFQTVGNLTLPIDLGILTVVSLSQCATECSFLNGTCLSFAFHPDTKQCGLSVLMPPFVQSYLESLPPGDGSKIYYYEDTACVLSVYDTTLIPTAELQTISSPNYPDIVPINLDMTWQIVKPTTSSVVFNGQFDLDGRGCNRDRLLLYAGVCNGEIPVYGYCGTGSFTETIADGFYIRVRLITDSQMLTHTGFTLTYKLA